MNRRIEYCSIAAGAVLLVSGFAKALDAAAFSRTLASYGFEGLRFLAPIVILAELALGSSLLLGVRLRRTGLLATLFLAGLTIVFAYGALFRGIDDCGCFGAESPLNGPPAATLLRNAVLLALTGAVWLCSKEDLRAGEASCRVFLGVMCAGAFICGFSFRTDGDFGRRLHYESIADAVAETPLAELVTTHPDSTYLIFAFSYTCPHCLNSIENLKRYESGGAVDRVVALAPEHPIAEGRFREEFSPGFCVRNLRAETLFRLTHTFPTAYYIRCDTVRAVLTGELPAALLFRQAFGGKDDEKTPPPAGGVR